MKVTKLIEKLMAVALIGAAFSLVSCEKTMEGVSEDASKAVDAAAENAAEGDGKVDRACECHYHPVLSRGQDPVQSRGGRVASEATG